MRRRLILLLLALAGALVIAVSSALAYQTFYAGSSTTYVTVGQTPFSTTGVAQRIDNKVHVAYNAHMEVWYVTSNATGNIAFGWAYTNNTQDAVSGKSAFGGTWYYSYAKCKTTNGFGSNSARCWTDW
jgi:hypothetical protein